MTAAGVQVLIWQSDEEPRKNKCSCSAAPVGAILEQHQTLGVCKEKGGKLLRKNGDCRGRCLGKPWDLSVPSP